MYTIISTTNLIGSNTLKVSKEYQRFFKEQGVEAQIFSMEELQSMQRDDKLEVLENKYLFPTTKFVFVMPEYNGSFPGIFKLLMDITDITRSFYHKKVMLVGIANGRAGNLRGIDTMTNMCHYMRMNVFYNKIPLSGISQELRNDQFHSEVTLKLIRSQIEGFIAY